MTSNIRLIIARRRQRRHAAKNNNQLPKITTSAFGVVIVSLAFSVIAGLGSAVGVYAHYAQQLPPAEMIEIQTSQSFKTTTIYDRTGTKPLYEVFDPRWGNRTVVSIDQIPDDLINATIAIEDQNFYTNPGINLRGIMRAFYVDITGQGFQGGSSITQLLVKNVIIAPEERTQRTLSRKIKEAILAVEITRRYSKDQILEWYLNTVFFGNMAYGAEAAAQAYYGKHVQDLSLAECAMLSALPNAPATYSPLTNPEEATIRQYLVLDAMFRQGYMTYDEIVAAKAEELHYAPVRFDIEAPHFVMYVRQLLEERYGSDLVYQGGLKVYTTLDLDLQRVAEDIARQHIAELQADERNASNAAVVAIKPPTGEILVMVGSLDYFEPQIDGQVNVALAERQPGSSFKMFTYTEALLQGHTPASLVMDVRTTFPDPDFSHPYTPENYDREFHGPLRLRQALARSINVAAVKVLSWVGVRNVIDVSHRMGINTLTQDYYGLSLTLGGGEVRLLDMTYAFSVLANGGYMAGQPVPDDKLRPGYRELDPVAILRVEDANGNVLEEYQSAELRDVISPQVAYVITHMLSDNVARTPAFGSRSMLWLGNDRPVAAKTGTTTDFKDSWTMGFTPQLCAGVWVGNSDNAPMEHVPGSRGAAPIWHNLMLAALESEPVVPFVEPPGLEWGVVDATSGLLPTEYSPSTVREVFLPGTVPTEHDNIHQMFHFCRTSGKLATVYCPLEEVREKVYEIYPPEAADWVRENDVPQPPTEYCDVHGPTPLSGDVAITKPRPYDYIRGLVQIQGNARGPNVQLYRLQYGPGLNPSSWTQIGGDHPYTVDNGLLETWDVRQLDGLYTLQLSVVDWSNYYRQATIQVTVDTISPTVEITYPITEQLYIMEDDEWVSIQAQAMDNFSMDRVEFHLDDELLTYDTVSPFNQRWTIVMTTTLEEDAALRKELTEDSPIEVTNSITVPHTIHVVAVDAAGNRMKSEEVMIYVVHKQEEEEQPEASNSDMSLEGRWAFVRREDEILVGA
ncbi:MAG: penicillin-binding protein [Chloroflexi bacterium B3_Chlor]|nr:MAG: penicillin-binding protein [Chloroflexi bacterium B3_Chlor]